MTTPNEKPDGGPAPLAFPCGWLVGENGMTMRDYFAAAALQGALMNYTTEKFGATEETVAIYAYRYADAMLAARQSKGQP